MGRNRVALAGGLFFLSGFSALIYQVGWQRILALHSGVGLYSVAMIVAAFMAGLGVGSHAGGVISARIEEGAALRLFALLELAVALFGAVSPSLYYDWLYPLASGLPSPSWRGGLLHFLALLPPTALMGMSLPFLVRAMVRDAAVAGRTIGVLYGVNVLGASMGALVAPWLLIPRWGIPGALLAAACGNAVAGLGAFGLGLLPTPEGDRGPEPPPAPATDESSTRRPFSLWVALYALSGFCALSLEIVWFRLIDVAVKATAFAFGTVLAVYLFGLAIGCLVGAGFAARLRRPLATFLACEGALLAYSAAAVILLVRIPSDTRFYRSFFAYWGEYDFFRLGHVWDAGTVARLYLILPAFLYALPTAIMGFAFVVLQRAVHDDPRTSGWKVGILQAANIAGCALGSLLVGLASLRFLGSAGTLRLLMGCGLVFAGVGIRYHGRRFVLAAVALGILALTLPGQEELWRRLHGQPGDASAPVFIREDATSVVALTPEDSGRWRLSVNGKGNSYIPYGGVHTLLGALPAVIHPSPRDVAVIGLGSGDTAWAAACRWETRTLTVFEISTPQRELLKRLEGAQDLPDLRRFLRDGRIRVVAADGRHALGAEEARYDVIEMDATWPESAYSGNLYSLEFFRACVRRLKPGGIMCSWAPTPRAHATFCRAFPNVIETPGGEILVGSREPLPVDLDAWRTNLRSPPAASYLGAERLEAVEAQLNLCRAAAGESDPPELNYDLFPRDEFASP